QSISSELSHSYQYSIRRNTITMKMVCGQTQQQKTLPKATVKKVMNNTPIIMEMTNRWKSWGQKGNPNILKRRSNILNIKNWLPFIFKKGDTNRNASKK